MKAIDRPLRRPSVPSRELETVAMKRAVERCPRTVNEMNLKPVCAFQQRNRGVTSRIRSLTEKKRTYLNQLIADLLVGVDHEWRARTCQQTAIGMYSVKPWLKRGSFYCTSWLSWRFIFFSLATIVLSKRGSQDLSNGTNGNPLIRQISLSSSNLWFMPRITLVNRLVRSDSTSIRTAPAAEGRNLWRLHLNCPSWWRRKSCKTR